MQTTYLSCAETAKLVRAALKKAFPTIKFSVKSHTYSGGASINVSWMDGPTTALVEPIADAFAGGRFDGSIDLKIRVEHWLLPDGSVTIASNQGTASGGGCINPEREWMPTPDAKLVHLGADFVSCRRELSERFVRQACARLARHGFDEFTAPHIRVWNGGAASIYGLTWQGMDEFNRLVSRLVIA